MESGIPPNPVTISSLTPPTISSLVCGWDPDLLPPFLPLNPGECPWSEHLGFHRSTYLMLTVGRGETITTHTSPFRTPPPQHRVGSKHLEPPNPLPYYPSTLPNLMPTNLAHRS